MNSFVNIVGKLCKNANSLRNHERMCKQNPERQVSPFVKLNAERGAWNKGLTKETDERVAKFANTLHEHIQAGISCQYDHKATWTEERRKEQSVRKKKLYAEHPEKHPNAKLAGNHAKLTYPEQLAYDWLVEHNYNPIHNWHYKTDKINRYVDFYIDSLKLIIEIDGEYWHVDATLDKAKDEDAQANGFTTLRIKPKDGVVNQLKTFFL